MTVPNFMSKAGSYQDLGRKTLCAPPRGMIRQKYPGAARVNEESRQINPPKNKR